MDSTALTKTIHDIYNLVVTDFGTGMFSHSTAVMGRVLPFFLLGLSIYMVMVIWDYYNRGVDESISDFVKRMIGWFLIILLVANHANYNKLAVALYALPDEITGIFSSSGGIGANMFDNLVNGVISNIVKIYNAMDKASIIGKIFMSIALVISILGGFVGVAINLGMFLIAKVSLAITLVVGPIFIACLMYPTTRQYGMNWVSQVFNYGLSAGLYTLVLGAYIKLVTGVKPGTTTVTEGWWFKTTSQQIIWSDALIFAISLLISSLLGIVIMFSVPSIASALIGGASISSGGRMTPMGALTSPISAAKGAASLGSKLASPLTGAYRKHQAQKSQAKTIAMAAKMLQNQK